MAVVEVLVMPVEGDKVVIGFEEKGAAKDDARGEDDEEEMAEEVER